MARRGGRLGSNERPYSIEYKYKGSATSSSTSRPASSSMRLFRSHAIAAWTQRSARKKVRIYCQSARGARAKPIGRLSFGIRRVRVVDSPRAALANSRVVLAVEYAGRRFRTTPKRVTWRGETFVGHDGAVASVNELRDADGAASRPPQPPTPCSLGPSPRPACPSPRPRARGLAAHIHNGEEP